MPVQKRKKERKRKEKKEKKMKKREKNAEGFEILYFYWSFSSDIMAAKGLII